MARNFNLNKGDRFSLSKDGEGLSKLRVELKWDSEADLDASAFLIGDDGLILDDADFVFYNSQKRSEDFSREKFGSKANWRKETVPVSFDGSVVGSADDLGGDDSGETMFVDLAKTRPEVTEIVFCVTIHGNQSFKDVKDPQIAIIDEENGVELCHYNLKQSFSTESAVVAGALVLSEEGEWEFEAIGNGYDGGLQTLIDMYAS